MSYKKSWLPRLPWKIRYTLDKTAIIFRYCEAYLFSYGEKIGPVIQFEAGFHGQSGGAEAIAIIANLLSRDCNVSFNAGPLSVMNLWLDKRVKRKKRNPDVVDILICDRSADIEYYLAAPSVRPAIICSVHGFSNSLHGLSADKSYATMSSADALHFVNENQQSDFLNLDKPSIVIPNACGDIYSELLQSKADTQVGMVGYLNRPSKNLEKMLVVLRSGKFESAVIWGEVPDGFKEDATVTFNGFSSNKQEIFYSFNVFLSLSLEETFGMVAIQAMSAGRPCVLARIPAFQQHDGAPGVFLVDPNDVEEVSAALRTALSLPPEIAQDIRSYWASKFSFDAIRQVWAEYINQVLQNRRTE